MRKAIYRADDDEGRALLARAPAIHLAMVSEAGAPILRTFNAVVVDGAIAFHGAPAGEKMEGIGRPAVVSAEETVASIPSYFLDPERACPATTYYLAAQAHGVLEEVTDLHEKARVLSALMAKYQPEGGHVPLSGNHPLYRKAVAGLLVARVTLDHVTCKAKLGQNRTPADRVRVIEQLWKRGAPGDVRAIAFLLARFADLPAPSFLQTSLSVRGGPVSLRVALADEEIEQVLDLLVGDPTEARSPSSPNTGPVYWLEGLPRESVRASIEASTATVSAWDAFGKLVAFARAVSDGKCAWIYDVVVAHDVRSSGVGTAVIKLLLDHPRVRGAQHVRLTTRDAMTFYRRLGFKDLAEAPRRPWPTTEMVRELEPAAQPEPRAALADERHDVRLVAAR